VNRARLQLHWAAQAAAGVGRTLLPKKEDHSEESFTWSDVLGALVQAPVDGRRAGLRLCDLTLIVANERAEVVEAFAMRHHTLDDGFAFFEAIFAATLARPAEGMPEPPSDFNADAQSLARFASLYATANAILTNVRDERWEPVRCWPHHFDIATLRTLSGSGEAAHTIGAGMAPGDATFADPYYYVAPWPYPSPDAFPPLTHGRWNTQEWIGAILPAAHDRDEVESFFTEAIGALAPR
jgi:hypothetical protein